MEEGPASCGGVHKVDVISDEFSLNWTGSAMRTDRKRCIRQRKRKNNSAVLNSEDAYCEGYVNEWEAQFERASRKRR